jgi:hypothetical protein
MGSYIVVDWEMNRRYGVILCLNLIPETQNVGNIHMERRRREFLRHVIRACVHVALHSPWPSSV